MSVCLRRIKACSVSQGIRRNKMRGVHELSSLNSPLLQLILYILRWDACSLTTASVPVTGLEWKETWGSIQKGTTFQRHNEGTKTSWASPPMAFGSNSIRRGYMQGKGLEAVWHAMQHFPSAMGAAGSFNRVVTDEDVTMQQCQACCVICFWYQFIVFVYTL